MTDRRNLSRLDIYADMTARERHIFAHAVSGMVFANSVPEGEHDIYSDSRTGVFGAFEEALDRLLDTCPAFEGFRPEVDAERSHLWDYIGEVDNPAEEFANRVVARVIETGRVALGDEVRAWDHAPAGDRPDRYIEGIVEDLDIGDGRMCIRVTKDVTFPAPGRVGDMVITPHNGDMFFDSDYTRNRVEVLNRWGA